VKIMRAYKYRLYPTPEQEARLSAWVAAVRAVYNAALTQREWYERAVGTDPHGRD
jgi:transposase